MKDENTYGEKMARKGGSKVIYKGKFISKQSLTAVCKYKQKNARHGCQHFDIKLIWRTISGKNMGAGFDMKIMKLHT